MNFFLNLFAPNAPFLYHLKTSENRKVFWWFQGVEKGCIGNKWVNNIFCKYKLIHLLKKLFNPVTHDVKKWPNMFEIFYGVHTARFLKYVWSFFNIMHERVNLHKLHFHEVKMFLNKNKKIRKPSILTLFSRKHILSRVTLRQHDYVIRAVIYRAPWRTFKLKLEK